MADAPRGPLTPEQRAAMEARLAQLKALKASQEAASQEAASQQQQQQPVYMGYGYVGGDEDENDGGEEDDDSAEEAFLNSAETFFATVQQPPSESAMGGGGARMKTSTVSGIGSGDTVATTAADLAGPRELGDFELLRLAKMGDAVSFFDFAAMTKADVTTFVDNHGLNALHYAADSGNLNLIKQLHEKHTPYCTSEKGATPLDIAILTRQPQEVLDELKAIATEGNHADGTTHSGPGFKPFAEVLDRLAPAPPRVVMSKPTPTQPARRRTATDDTPSFWDRASKELPSPHALISPPGNLSVVVDAGVVEGTDASAVQKLYEARGSVCGCSGWLLPMETLAGSDAMCKRTMAVRAQSTAGDGKTVGFAACLAVGGQVSVAPGKAPLAAASASGLPLVIADHLVTAQQMKAQPSGEESDTAVKCTNGLADAILSTLGAKLVDSSTCGGGGGAVVAFTAPALLREPPTSVCAIKWFRRAMDALPVFADYKLADRVFPDFYKYDETLRAECVLKGSVSAKVSEKHAATVTGWACVDAHDDTQAGAVLEFLKAKTAASGAELFYVPKDLDDLRAGGLLSEGLSCLVKIDPSSGALTDFVAFRLRRSTSSGGGSGTAGVVVAELVYAVITTLKATDKAEHLLLIANDVLHAQVLLVPGTFGFTESDLVKANFDELPALREFAYVVYGSQGKVVSAQPVAAPKLCLPLFLL